MNLGAGTVTYNSAIVAEVVNVSTTKAEIRIYDPVGGAPMRTLINTALKYIHKMFDIK